MAVTREELLVLIRAENADLEKRLKQSGRSTEQFEDKVKRAAKTLLATFGAATIARGIINVANSFDRARRILVRSTGASGDALRRLDRDFKQVLGRVPDDAERVATVFGTLASQTDATGETLQRLSRDVLNAARVMGEDATQSTELFARVLQQWQVPAEHGSGLLNQLFTLSQRYGVGLNRLNTLLVEYGAVLTNAGFSLQETAELQARLTQAGLNWTRISPGINAAFRKWAGEGKDLRGELGLVIQRIKTASSQTEALAIATDTFGAEGAARLTRAIRNQVFRLDDLGKSLNNVKNTIEDTALAIETIDERFNRFLNRISGASSSLLDKLTGIVKGWIDLIDGLWRIFIEQWEGNLELVLLGVKAFGLDLQLALKDIPFADLLIDPAEVAKRLAEVEQQSKDLKEKLNRELSDLFPQPGKPPVVETPPIGGQAAAATAEMVALDVATLRVLNHTKLFEKEGSERLQALAEGSAFVTDQRLAEVDALKNIRGIEQAAHLATLAEADQRLAANVQASDAKLEAITKEVTAAKEAAALLASSEEDLANRITMINKAASAARTAVLAEEAAARAEILKREVDAHRDLERQLVRETLSGQAQRLQAVEDELAQRTAFIHKNVENAVRAQELITLAEQAAVQKRIEVARQFPSFWERQLQQLVDSNTFALAAIVNTWTSSIAQMIVRGGDLRAAWEATQIALVQAALNTTVQWIAEQARMLLFGQKVNTQALAAHTATEKAKTAMTAAQEVARTGIVLAANQLLVAGAITALGVMATVAQVMVKIMAVAIAATVAMLEAIATALTASTVTAALAVPVEAAAAGLAIAGAAAVTTATGAIQESLGSAIVGITAAGATPLQHGGIVTGPTFALLGEAGPEAVVPLSGRHGRAAMGGGETHIHVHVEADGRELAHVVARWLPGELDAMGVPL